MKATIVSTDTIVEISDPKGARALARVWEGTTEAGVPFVAYMTCIQIHLQEDNSQFERELEEHKRPEPATQRAIDARFIL